ncbi:MAG: hypothetical protein FK734_04920, partial [Asgard group archaeon]|nr:hypothetical protein [Asgard group archaeon]
DMNASLSPDYSDFYTENGTSNIFGYSTELDWNYELNTGKNEWYLNQGMGIFPYDTDERIQHYWDWENYLMDRICPLNPMFTPKTYSAYWGSLRGYNSTKQLIQSWGNMYWRSVTNHIGQNNRQEIVVSDHDYTNLNPIFTNDSLVNSKYINSFTMDPLLWIDVDRTIWPHLGSITYLNDTHLKIDVREGVTWANDTDDFFYDERLDAEDVYFTYYLWKNISNEASNFAWLKDMKITGNYTLELFIDANPATINNEPTYDYLPLLTQYILPEHYLNQTQLADGITPDTSHSSWEKFSKYCFGTGLFEISTQVDHLETVLKRRANSWWIDPNTAKDLTLNWQARFGTLAQIGDYTLLNKLRLTVTNNILEEDNLFTKGLLDIIDTASIFKDKYLRNTAIAVQQSRRSNVLSLVGYNLRPSRGVIGSLAPTLNDPGMKVGLAIRKAINYATNKADLNVFVIGNEYQIINHPINPRLGIWLNPYIMKYNYDLQLAKEIMVNAGFVIDNFTPSLNGYTMVISSVAILALITIPLFTKNKKNR